MKGYPSCVQELHPLCVGVGVACCDINTNRIKSSATATTSSRKGIRKLIVKRQSLASVYPRRAVSCLCFNDADHLGSTSPLGGDELDSRPDLNSKSREPERCRDESNSDSDSEIFSQVDEEDGIRIQISELGKRSRRVESSVLLNASLSLVWGILTDYERLADFIKGLAESRLLEKKENCVRLYQIGQQNLALGLKFNAKAVLDCYEKELEILSFGQRRVIEFKMVEGDFETFEGMWSIQQYDAEKHDEFQAFDLTENQEFCTVLSYVVKVEPKLWLPVRLVEGRLCREIKANLSCIRQEVQIRQSSSCS